MTGKVECKICGAKVARIGNHLPKHSMKTPEYVAMFPGAETCAYRHSAGTISRMTGERPSARGVTKSEEHRAKLSQARKGKKSKPHSPETLEKMRQAWVRRKADKEAYAAYVQGVSDRMSTPEMVQAVRDRTIKLIKSGNHNGKSKDTKLELDMKKYLERTGVAFEHQYILKTSKGDFIFDFYLPEMNLLVETDGEYWHRKSKMQINRDKLKERLCRDDGYDFIRISDLDWRPDIILSAPDIRDRHSAAIMAEREIWINNQSS